jgi:ubiquinone/menaquinone biosynthesis C-methylase UbiE
VTEEWRGWIAGFDRWAPTYDEATADPWFAYEAAWSFVERSLREGRGGELAGTRVVDVGCGTGAFLRRLADAGAEPVGVEPAAGMRAEALRKVPRARILDGHLAAIPLGDDAVDAAIATYVVSHLAPAEQPPAIAELLRVVAGFGPLVVVDVAAAAPADLPRVREVLRAAGRADQVPWYERGLGLDVAAWRRALEATGRRVVLEPLGPLVLGLAGLPPAT